MQYVNQDLICNWIMLTIKTNIEELIAKFKKHAEDLANVDFSEALLVGAEAGLGQMKYRIFNEGLDRDLVELGRYSKKNAEIKRKKTINAEGEEEFGLDFGLSPYEKERTKAGRQIRYKDLEFKGDLRRGMVIGVQPGKAFAWIPNDFLFKIAKYQEEQIGSMRGGGTVKIFYPSDDEKTIIQENTQQAIKQIYDRVFNNS